MTLAARPAWVPDAVFYQVFPDRFRNGDPTNDPPGSQPWGASPTREDFQGGDLAGLRAGLPYLHDLGITALYSTPVFAARTNHRYDTSDYLRVDPALGDAALLARTVAEAHGLGIRVLLDGVFNHCGDGFWAFQDMVATGADSRFREWFFPQSFPIRTDPPTYQTCGGASFLPKLNVDNPATRDYLLNVATYWLDTTNIDGWRLDVPWKATRGFWEAFHDWVKSHRPDAYLVGEIWRDGAEWQEVFDGVMNYRARDYLLDYCVRDAMDAEDFWFETARLFAHAETPWQLNLVGSHDTPRLLTLCGGCHDRAILALTALLLLPGPPMIYYGDEIGMAGENDPDCRRAMEWDRARWHGATVQRVRRLIALRHELPALRRGTWEPLFAFNGLFVVRRAHEDGDVIIVLNPRQALRDIRCAVPVPSGRWADRLSGQEVTIRDGAMLLGEIPARGALVLTRATSA